jgi:hypothetical protein
MGLSPRCIIVWAVDPALALLAGGGAANANGVQTSRAANNAERVGNVRIVCILSEKQGLIMADRRTAFAKIA